MSRPARPDRLYERTFTCRSSPGCRRPARSTLLRYLLLILAAAVAIPLAAAEADWRSPAKTEVPGIELPRDRPVVQVKTKAKPKAERKATPVQKPRRRVVRAKPSSAVRTRTKPQRTWTAPERTRTTPRRQVGAQPVTPRPAPAGRDDDDEVGDGDD
jgi:hypothetical protein